MIKQGYVKLIIYQKTKILVVLVYGLTKKFPLEERYSLVPQMRRAAISILANIVEGYSKQSRKDFARFLGISIASAMELGLYFDLSSELGYLTTIEFERANQLLIEIKKMLYSFQKTLKEKKS